VQDPSLLKEVMELAKDPAAMAEARALLEDPEFKVSWGRFTIGGDIGVVLVMGWKGVCHTTTCDPQAEMDKIINSDAVQRSMKAANEIVKDPVKMAQFQKELQSVIAST